MDILTNGLPSEIGGCPINTDYRTWIRIQKTLENQNAPISDRLVRVIELCYKTLPKNLDTAMEGIVCFLRGGNVFAQKNKNTKKSTQPIFSFDVDGELIFAAFAEQYGIDLLKSDMHWWKFLAYLKGIGPKTTFGRCLEIRGADLSKIKDKVRKGEIARLKAIYALPDIRSQEQKEADTISELSKFFM